MLIWLSSAEERVGRMMIIVTLQQLDGAASIDASRRKGVKCPIPALGHTATCGCVGSESMGVWNLMLIW